MKRVKITKQKVQPFGDFPLSVCWTPDGGSLLVSGELMLGIVKRDTWELTYSNSFAHKKPISCVEWLTEQYFATAGADKIIKVWDFEQSKLAFYVTSSCPVLQVSYCQAVSFK